MASLNKNTRTTDHNKDFVKRLVEKARAGKATSDSREDRLARLLYRALSDETKKDNHPN